MTSISKQMGEIMAEKEYKIGETLWSCYIEDGKRPVYMEHRVRSKRGGRWHAITITGYTWVKLRWGADQTRGWAKNIPNCCRHSCEVGETFPGLFRTKRQALSYAKRSEKAREARWQKRSM